MAPLPKQIAIKKIKALGRGTRLANQK